MREEMFAVYGLRGIATAYSHATPAALDRPWSVVGLLAAGAVEAAAQTEFDRFLDKIRIYQDPSALLIVRRYLSPQVPEFEECEQECQSLVAALNLLSLSMFSEEIEIQSEDGVVRLWPHPVYRARGKMGTRHDIIFDRSGLKFEAAGADYFFLLSPSRRLTNPELDDAFLQAPALVQDVLHRRGPRSFAATAFALSRAFDATTKGQFISQCLGALEILVGENDTNRWKELQQMVVCLCGAEAAKTVRYLFLTRHAFIHQNKEPDVRDQSHISCLAVTFAAMLRFSELLRIYGNYRAVQELLTAAAHLQKAEELRFTQEGIPISANELLKLAPIPKWASDWLSYLPTK